jgi:hypothetical protein
MNSMRDETVTPTVIFFTRDHRSISIKDNGNKRHQPEFRRGEIAAYR